MTHDDIIENSGIGLYTIHKDWASPLQDYLETCTFPKTLNKDQQRRISIKALPYSLVGRKLHNLCGDGIIHTCISSTKAHKILEQLHDGQVRGHFGPLTTPHKILVTRYWCFSLHKYVRHFCCNYDICQKTRPIQGLGPFPFIPIIPITPFV